MGNVNKLYIENEKFAIRTAIGFYNKLMGLAATYQYDLDDFIQMARIGLWLASIKYNPDSEAEFQTFAYACIKREIVRPFRTTKRRNGTKLDTLKKPIYHTSLFELIQNEHNGRTIEHIDLVSDIHRFEDEVEARVIIDDILSRLDDKSRYLIRQAYFKDRTFVSIAEELNVTRGTISRWFSEIYTKARKILSA